MHGPSVRRPLALLLLAAALLLAACGSASAGRSAGGGRTRAGVGTTGALAAAVRGTAARTEWPTYDRTGSRSGLSPSTPAVGRPGAVARGWSRHLDGRVYGQPLVVGSHVVVATENDTVYALGRWTGKVVWSRHLASPVTGGLPCGDVTPSGITGTPVADLATRRLYVVTFTARPSFHHTLWTLDLTDGRVVRSRGIDPPGADPAAEQERGALVIDGSKVFVPYGGLDGDCSDYHGWVVGAPLSGRGSPVHFVTPTKREGGIWSPPGAAVGPDGVYVATGNGTPVNAIDDANSVLRLSPTTLAVRSRFTPADYARLSAEDQDLGSTTPEPLPGNNVFMIGKEGVGYVLGADHLGGTGHPLASRSVCTGGFGGDAVDGDVVFVSCFDGLYAVRYTPGNRSTPPRLAVAWSVTGVRPGPPVVAGGIVWTVTRDDQLVGYRAGTGARFVRFPTATVGTSFPSLSAAAGRLFVPEGSEVVSYRGV